MEEGDGHAGGFAEAIRAWRQRRGWTQEELSHASGLSTRAIRSLERGRTQRPRRTTVQMLADALQVPRARLMGTVRRAVGEADAEAGGMDSEAPPASAGVWTGRTGPGGGPPTGSSATGSGLRTGGTAGGDMPGGSTSGLRLGGTAAAHRRRAGTTAADQELWAGSTTDGSGLPNGEAAAGNGPIAEQLAAERALSALLSVPRELPPDLADHELDVREVVAELVAGPSEPYRAAVVRVASSEVAIRAAHHASAKFSDGQLYASLAGTPPPAPAAVLRRFLRSLHIDRPAEATADELAAAFRTALAGRRILVVLVEARSEAQVRPLIPAEAQCALLAAFPPDRRPSEQPAEGWPVARPPSPGRPNPPAAPAS